MTTQSSGWGPKFTMNTHLTPRSHGSFGTKTNRDFIVKQKYRLKNIYSWILPNILEHKSTPYFYIILTVVAILCSNVKSLRNNTVRFLWYFIFKDCNRNYGVLINALFLNISFIYSLDKVLSKVAIVDTLYN